MRDVHFARALKTSRMQYSDTQIYRRDYLNPIRERALSSIDIHISSRGMPMYGGPNVTADSHIFFVDIDSGVVTVPQSVQELQEAGIPEEFIDRVKMVVAYEEKTQREAEQQIMKVYAGVAVGIIALLASGWFVYKRRRR